MRMSDWSSDVCSSYLRPRHAEHVALLRFVAPQLQRRQRRVVAGHLVQVDHAAHARVVQQLGNRVRQAAGADVVAPQDRVAVAERDAAVDHFLAAARSEEHTSELQSLMRISYAVFCLKKKKQKNQIE